MARRPSSEALLMANTMEGVKKKRVLIVGAGAAGMSCAQQLAQHPEKFDVTVVDAVNYCGGQAYSIPIDKQRYGASWLNQGVQGGSYIFHHTMAMFARQGYHADPVKLQVSFGKGSHFWSNVFPTQFLEKHQNEVQRFTTMIKVLRWFEVIFALIPIKLVLKIFRFSYEFANVVALPMVALFLGTGNYAPDVPTIMLERLCTSPTYGMWYPTDKESVVSNMPPMVVFPNFSDFYETWRKNLVGQGVNIRLSTEVTAVVRRDDSGVVVKTIKRTVEDDDHNQNSAWVPAKKNPDDKNTNRNADAQETEEHYDELVLCCLADTASRLLKPTISRLESAILARSKWSDDVTVTHNDAAYMRRHYENFFNAEQAVTSLGGVAQHARVEFAKEKFKPMYYIKMYDEDLSKLEMCFDCTNYQAQFPPEVDFDRHVFQTIFLNKKRDGHLWSIDEIDKSKIIRTDWWHQLCHSYTHYLFVIPFLWLIQARKSLHTRFASAWTLVNAHEVAVISGIAAAVNLGADYPADLERDRFSFLAFRLYYLLQYASWYGRKATKVTEEGVGKGWASGVYGSVYRGPGVVEGERTMWKEECEREREGEGRK